MSDYYYDPENDTVKNPYTVSNDMLENDLNSDSDSYNSEYINNDIRNSLAGSEGIDLNKYAKEKNDIKNIDVILHDFNDPPWSDLSLEDQKHSITDLANYVAVDTGNENPPEIIFSNDMPDGTYGGYNPSSNTIEINVNMLDNSTEAADTIAHEMWHAYQQQEAMNPNSEKGQEYQEGFDNYISPEYDFEGYENQMVEAEARDYAQGFRDRIKGV